MASGERKQWNKTKGSVESMGYGFGGNNNSTFIVLLILILLICGSGFGGGYHGEQK